MSSQPIVSTLAVPVGERSSDRVAALFDAHHQRVYRLARRLTPTADDALDLVQETFLRAARSTKSVLADSGRMIYLHPETIVTNDDIAQSWATEDGPDRFGVSVELLEAGAQRMRQATAAHIGRPVAILIDGQVVMAPVVRSAIGNSAMITGHFTRAEAARIADGIGVR